MPASARASASSPPRPKTQGSPPFSRSALAVARERDQSGRDVGLTRRWAAAALPGVIERRPRTRQRQDARVDERVIDDGVGLFQRMQRQHRQQAGVARPGADQPDASGLQLRKFEARVVDHGVPRNVARR